MEFHLLHIFTFLSLALVVSHATQVNEVYWNTMLNNTRMPKALKDLLISDQMTKEKASEVSSNMNVNSQSSSDPLFDYHSYATKHQIRNPQSDSPFAYRYVDNDLQKNTNPQSDSPFAYRYADNDLQKNTNPQSDSPFAYRYADNDLQKNTNPQSESPFAYRYADNDLQKNTNPQSESPFAYRYADNDLQKNINPQSDSPFAYRYADNDRQKNTNPQSDSPFAYRYAAKKPLHKNNHNTTIFFLEKDLHQGTNMSLHFIKSPNAAAFFLPRKTADSIPFSSRKIPEILNQLSVNPNSREAQIIKKSIKQCEDPGIKEEEKLCVTSLESMIDFAIAKLGKNVEAISTEAENATQMQNYNIHGLKKMASEKNIVCHKQNYPYAVFYCHKTYATEVFVASLVGDHGGRVEALAVCHQDTSEWNPKHLAFVLLKVKPGTVPICHFLPEDNVVWINK